MTFQQKLDFIIQKNNSLVCIGLDSNVATLPSSVKGDQFLFNKAIIDATHDLVCAYKPNSAFYEGAGASGIEQLKKTCDYIRNTYPEIIIILDAKRGDIGNTNNGYVEYAFEYLGVDAITLHPYLGKEALQPFLDREDKGCIILCKTSNPGSGEFQDMIIEGKPLSFRVAETVSKNWNTNGNCLLVVGATYPEELAEVRRITEMTFLVPGIGAQGGDLEKTMKNGLNSKKTGMIINSSREIIFASNGENFAEKAREETDKLRNEINVYKNK